ncbi:MAG: hypothetical protein D8M59_16625 [Planctomycetes bacterium]|nr:hypothetical protein [Planctomycetota bacterium]
MLTGLCILILGTAGLSGCDAMTLMPGSTYPAVTDSLLEGEWILNAEVESSDEAEDPQDEIRVSITRLASADIRKPDPLGFAGGRATPEPSSESSNESLSSIIQSFRPDTRYVAVFEAGSRDDDENPPEELVLWDPPEIRFVFEVLKARDSEYCTLQPSAAMTWSYCSLGTIPVQRTLRILRAADRIELFAHSMDFVWVPATFGGHFRFDPPADAEGPLLVDEFDDIIQFYEGTDASEWQRIAVLERADVDQPTEFMDPRTHEDSETTSDELTIPVREKSK